MDPELQQFGDDRFTEMLVRSRTESLEDSVSLVLRKMETWSGEAGPRDDLAGTWQVVLFERDGKSRSDLISDLQMKFSRGRLELMQRGRQTIVLAYDLTVMDYPGISNGFIDLAVEFQCRRESTGWKVTRSGCVSDRLTKGEQRNS